MTDNSPRPPIGVSDQLRDEIAQIKTVKTDADIAAELRAKIAPHLAEACKVMDDAIASGLKLDFVFQPNGFGKHFIPFISVTKAL